jgi:XTP/dITP diphosphohydrolase
MRFTLDKLKDVSLENRTATFTTVAAVVSPKGEKKVFSGSVRGIVLTEPRTACQPNMPCSALFVPDGQNKVWAEMSVEEENVISHRGKAFTQVRDFFAQVLN